MSRLSLLSCLVLMVACGEPTEDPTDPGTDDPVTDPVTDPADASPADYIDFLPARTTLSMKTSSAGFSGQSPPPGDGYIDGPFDRLEEWAWDIDTTLGWVMEYIELAQGSDTPFAEGETDAEWRVDLPDYPGQELVVKISLSGSDRYVYRAYAGPIAFEPGDDDLLFSGATITTMDANESWTYNMNISVDALEDLRRDASVRISGEIELSGHTALDGGWEVFYDFRDVKYSDSNESWSQHSTMTYHERVDGISQLWGELVLSNDLAAGLVYESFVWDETGGRVDRLVDAEEAGEDYLTSQSGCWDASGATLFDAIETAWDAGETSGIAEGDDTLCTFEAIAENPDVTNYASLTTDWSPYVGGDTSFEDTYDVVMNYYYVTDIGYDVDSVIDPVFEVSLGNDILIVTGVPDTETDDGFALTLFEGVTARTLLSDGMRVFAYDADEVYGESATFETVLAPTDDLIVDMSLTVTETELDGNGHIWTYDDGVDYVQVEFIFVKN